MYLNLLELPTYFNFCCSPIIFIYKYLKPTYIRKIHLKSLAEMHSVNFQSVNRRRVDLPFDLSPEHPYSIVVSHFLVTRNRGDCSVATETGTAGYRRDDA